jgi:WD40 repeat protein
MSAEWRRIGLFVSSTFDDMQAERDHLVKRVLPRLAEWCDQRRLHLVDVDLRWGITEAAARERGIVLKCLQAIDASRPLLVCLLGQRRGRVVAAGDLSPATIAAYPGIRDLLGAATVTEIEIAHALPDAEALAYLRDARAEWPDELRPVYTNAWLDDPDERAGHDAAHVRTRERVRRGAAVARDYRCRWDAAAGRLADFAVDGRPLADVLLEDLQDAIVRLHPDRAEPSLTDGEDDQQEQFLARVTDAPVERADTYAALDAYVAGDDTGVLAITAPSGIGKTTVLAQWLARRDDRPIARFIGASEGSTAVGTLLASIAPAATRKTWTELVRGTVVLDALDQLDEGLADLDWLPWTLPPGLKVIVSYATDTPAGAELRARMAAGAPLVHDLAPLDDLDQRRQVVEHYLSGYLKELDRDLVEALIRTPAAGNPLYLKVILSELRVFGAYAGIRDQLRERFGDDPQSAFGALLERLETDPAYTEAPSERVVPLFFGLLARARAGLAVDEAAAIVATRLPACDPRAAADAIQVSLRQVRAFTARRLGRHDFLHSSFRAAARERYADEDWHGLLSDYFDALAPDSRRRLSELPYHLTAAGRDERARDVLCDLRFIEGKCAAGLTTDLVADVERAAPLAPLPEFAGFLRREAHNLARHGATPGFARQQAVNAAAAGPVHDAGVRALDDDVTWLRRLDPPRVPGGALLATLEGLDEGATDAAFVGGGRVLAAGRDGSVRLWHAGSGRRLETIVRLEPGLDSCDVSPDGRLVALGCDDGLVRVHDRVTRATLVCAGRFDQSPRRCRFLPDGRLLSVGRFGLMVHDPATGECLHAYAGDLTVSDWALGPGSIVALACQSASVCLYDLAAGAVLERLRLERDEGLAWTCAFSPDGSRLLGCGGKLGYSDDVAALGQTSVWRTDTWEAEHEIRFDVAATACCFHRDDAFAVGLLDGTIHLHGVDGRQLSGIGAHSSTVRSLRTAGDRLVSASLDGRVRVWSVPALLEEALETGGGRFCARDAVFTGAASGFEYRFDHVDVPEPGHTERTTKLWQNHVVRPRPRMFRQDHYAPLTVKLVTHTDRATAPHVTAPLHRAGAYWLLASSGRMWPFEVSLLPDLPEALQSTDNVRWAQSLNGALYAVLQPGRLLLHHPDGPAYQWEFECNSAKFHLPQCHFSTLRPPTILFICGPRLYAARAAWSELAVLYTSKGGPLNAFSESPDGARIAVARDDGVVVVASRVAPPQELRGHDGPVADCGWAGDDLVSLGRDGTLRLWRDGVTAAVFAGATAITAFWADDRIVAADAAGRVYTLAPV